MDQKCQKSGHGLRLVAVACLSLLGLSACSSSSDDDPGFINLYNASKNSPPIFLTVDEDLDDDDDNEIEVTYRSVDYGRSSGNIELPDDTYTYELAWQDDDETDRNSLRLIHQDEIRIRDEAIQMVVISEDINNPVVNVYDIPVVDDDDDIDDDLFNLRVLNIHPETAPIDVHMSRSDQTFNEATLVGSYSYQELSENQKFEEEEYIFYITLAGSTDILYESDEIDFPFTTQYVMVVRENSGSGDSPYIIDRVSNSNTEEYVDNNAQAKFRVYNGIRSYELADNYADSAHELLDDYTGSVDIYVNGIDGDPIETNVEVGTFSEVQTFDNGDYALELIDSGNQEEVLRNHLLTLGENTDKTVFFYLEEEDIDDDNDGNVDENNDGIVDLIEIHVRSLVVENSVVSSISDHEVTMINFVDNDDFNAINFYFVRSNETVENAFFDQRAPYAQEASIDLLNNTYQVFAIASSDTSEIILDNFELILNEDSSDLFFILEEDETSSTGHSVKIVEQVVE